MTVHIQIKKIEKKLQQLKPRTVELPEVPQTLRELINMLVCIQVKQYNARIASSANVPLSAAEMDDMASVGKIGFGIPFGKAAADPEEAVQIAISGFEDGLYRVLIGETEAELLDAPLALEPQDTITILRLVMLTGGFF